MYGIKWSILIASITERWPAPVIRKVAEQAKAYGGQIEVLAITDNRLRTVGAKRNTLLSMARGDYVSFVDDDDDVRDDYVGRIVPTLGSADVTVFKQEAILVRERQVHRCRYTLRARERTLVPVIDPVTGATEVDNEGRLVSAYEGPPAHTHVWRATIARAVAFPLKNWQEDTTWCDIVARRCQSEVQIPETLYFYQMDSEKSATRGSNATPPSP